MKYYFTFGFGQRYENCFTIIEADSYMKARKEMVRIFEKKWAFQYDEESWFDEKGVSQEEKYNLREIK